MSASSVSILGVLYHLNLSNIKTTLIRRLWTSLRSAGDGVLVISMFRAIKPFWSRAKNKSEPSFGSIPQPTTQTKTFPYLFLSWYWVIVGFVASDASACWLWFAAGRSSNQSFFSSSFSTAMNRVHREWRCSVDFATGLQSPEGRRWDCNLAAMVWRNSLTFVIIGYTDPSIVMQSGANVRSRFKEFIDSRRWIGFIRKSSLVDFAKAMTLFYRGVMLLLLTSL